MLRTDPEVPTLDERRALADGIRRWVAAGRCANCGHGDPDEGELLAEGVWICYLCASRRYHLRLRRVLLCVAAGLCGDPAGLCPSDELGTACGRSRRLT
jgi:hypothetical protein